MSAQVFVHCLYTIFHSKNVLDGLVIIIVIIIDGEGLLADPFDVRDKRRIFG